MSMQAHPHPDSGSLEGWVEDAAFVAIFVAAVAIVAVIVLLMVAL